MTARTKSKVTPKYKTKYRVTNWAAYEESLRNRGDITSGSTRTRSMLGARPQAAGLEASAGIPTSRSSPR